MKTAFAALVTFAALGLASAEFSGFHEVDLFSHSSHYDAPEFKLYFRVEGEHIIFGAKVGVTNKWFSVGQTSSGGMIGADLAIFTPDPVQNTYTLGDYWSTGFNTPVLDEQQDLELLDVAVGDGEVIVQWMQPLRSCDQEQDLDIKDVRESKVIFAIGYGPHLSMHQFRSNYNLDWFRGDITAQQEAALETDLISFIAQPYVPNPIPADESTIYRCAFVPFEDSHADLHRVKAEPIVDSKYLHHMLFFICGYEPTESHHDGTPIAIGEGFECGVMPPKGCQGAGGWAVGQGTEYLPENVGMLVPKGTRAMMIQYHYDNPNYEAGGQDRSGVVFHMTPTLREHDMASFHIANSIMNLEIPAGHKAYDMVVDLPTACTSQMSIEETNIDSVTFHMHKRGTYTWLEHWRDGKRLPDISQQHWDFNHQTGNPMPAGTKLRRGDHLRLHCIFDTSKDTEAVMGGDGTDDEMCIAFMNVWPPADIQLSIRLDKMLAPFTPPDQKAQVCIAGTGELSSLGLTAVAARQYGEKPNPMAMLKYVVQYDALPASSGRWVEPRLCSAGHAAPELDEEEEETIQHEQEEERGGELPDMCVCVQGQSPACMQAAVEQCQTHFATTPYCAVCFQDPTSAACTSSMTSFLTGRCAPEVQEEEEEVVVVAAPTKKGAGVRYLTVTHSKANSAHVLWAAPKADGCHSQHYAVEVAAVKKNGKPGKFQRIGFTDGDGASWTRDTQAWIEGLRPSTRYAARVVPVSAAGAREGRPKVVRFKTRKGGQSSRKSAGGH